MIPKVIQKEIIKLDKDYNPHDLCMTEELEQYLNDLINNRWEYDNFPNKGKAEVAYHEFLMTSRVWRYCKAHNLSTKKGTYHSFNGREDKGIWYIVHNLYIAMDGEANGIKWAWRTVDGLKNVQIWFV